MFTIHPFEPTDSNYEAIVAIENAVWPDNPGSIESFKHYDQTRNPAYLFQRLVVEADRQVVAYGHYREPSWSYQPGKYDIGVVVYPDFEARGIRAAFYDYALKILAERQPKPNAITSRTREDKPQAIRFLEKHGFKQVMRWPESQLDVTSFDPAKFAQVVERVQQQGLKIYQISELQELDPNWQRNFYELDWACTLDEPSPDPLTQQPIEDFVNQFLNDPDFMPEAWFIALDGNQYVGLTGLFKVPANSERFYSGFTGVLPSHRRRGIATALKVRAIEFARQYGVKFIKTNNEENNPMYNLNLMLGFQPGPAWLAFKKIIGEEFRP